MSSTMLEMRGQFDQLSQLMVVMGNKLDIVMKAPQEDKTGFQERTIFQRSNAKQTQTERPDRTRY